MMTGVFLYGTLRHVPLLEAVVGRDVAADELVSAYLQDHHTVWAKGQAFPLIFPFKGEIAPGLWFAGATADDLKRLDHYESVFGYDRAPLTVLLENGELQRTTIWWPPTEGVERGDRWDLVAWARDWGAVNTRAAWELMSYYDMPVGEQPFYGQMHARAASYVRAQSEPAQRSLTQSKNTVTPVSNRRPYADYFAIDERTVTFPKFDGSTSASVTRAVFHTADASLLLPYDPVRDRVMLVEQFRAGPLVRGDHDLWQPEPIAGRVDPGETPAEAAMREAEEEAGLTLQQLIPIHEGYPSPGCTSEYYYVYLGLADLPDEAAGVAGLESEDEDIRSHLIPFEDAMDMLDAGRLRVTPLAMALLWLARNRDRLRANA